MLCGAPSTRLSPSGSSLLMGFVAAGCVPARSLCAALGPKLCPRPWRDAYRHGQERPVGVGRTPLRTLTSCGASSSVESGSAEPDLKKQLKVIEADLQTTQSEVIDMMGELKAVNAKLLHSMQAAAEAKL